jgi:hypothetical protein
MTMHVLISISAALLMQTPGVHISALDAATTIERAVVLQDRVAPASHAMMGRVCPCPHSRHAS